MRFQWERVVRDCTLPPTTKLVALMLATYASGDGTHAHPGQDRLARECGLKLERSGTTSTGSPSLA
jgi:hypothetical protein